MTTLRAAAQQALEALEGGADSWQRVGPAIDALKAALAEPAQEHDLSRCPKCNGPADNGHDREVPPNPYVCTKCMAEPVAWRWGYRSVTTGEMDWRGYVEIPAHPNLRSPEIIMEPLYTAPQQRPAKPQGCDHCNHPLYAATKCRVCGRVTEPTPPQRKPLSEDEKRALADKFLSCQPESYEVSGVFDLISAAERAHGIGGEE